MKKFLLMTVAAMMATMMLTSCSNDDDKPRPAEMQAGAFENYIECLLSCEVLDVAS